MTPGQGHGSKVGEAGHYDRPMAWTPPTVGDGFVRAPGGLGFVQDFVNTGYHGQAQPIDPLVDPDDARSWLAEALRLRAIDLGPTGKVTIDDRDVKRMRDLRRALTAIVDAGGSATAAGWAGPSVSTSIGADGTVAFEPQGDGYRRFAGLVAIDAFVAQQAGTWSRLKICRSARCGVAFYDRSRNSSAVWHDAKVCGNA